MGRKRKTVLYREIMLSKCGGDWTDVERVCIDRDGLKKCVNEQKRSLNKSER